MGGDKKKDKKERKRSRSRSSERYRSREDREKGDSNSNTQKRKSRFDLGLNQSQSTPNKTTQESPLLQSMQITKTSSGQYNIGNLNNSATQAISQFQLQMMGQMSTNLNSSNNSLANSNSNQLVLGGNSAITINSMFDIHARRLYVGGVPAAVTDAAVVQFLTQTLRKAGGILEAGDPIVKSQNNPDKRYTFLELRSVEETSAMIQLDGIKFMNSTLRIRRPEDYEKMPNIMPKRAIPQINIAELGIISTKVEEGPNKIFVGGLPKEFTEEQIKNLLLRYGKLKSFHLVKDTKIDASRGFAFCEYLDDNGVQNALKFLNGMKIGSRNINVRRTGQNTHLVQQNQFSEEDKKNFQDKIDDFIYETGKLVSLVGVNENHNINQFEELDKHNETMASYISQYCGYNTLSTVMDIKVPALNKEILEDEIKYEEIMKEMNEELGKFGKIKSMIIPRSQDMMQTTTVKPSSIGKVFVEFEEVTSGFACYNLLNSRVYMGHPVEINFYSKDLYVTKSLM
ncbi:splicing factor u2af large [Stylonychia lemnae]|uniref:Splicing factor u2af large n=1 Tax=Stylonychia lemnae TaxID=5949 RepID=A0A078AR43_STYLE|nr:splicing factor u2af large [Stylonychia lemnae]|eukprot:CDW84689.1 splicing factor u2af large [Stylonychia lemnae]